MKNKLIKKAQIALGMACATAGINPAQYKIYQEERDGYNLFSKEANSNPNRYNIQKLMDNYYMERVQNDESLIAEEEGRKHEELAREMPEQWSVKVNNYLTIGPKFNEVHKKALYVIVDSLKETQNQKSLTRLNESLREGYLSKDDLLSK